MFPGRSRSHRSFYRYDVGHLSHTGLKARRQEVYRDWEIQIEHCVLGLTLRREQFNVRIAETTSKREEYLKGFLNRVTAVEAARSRIDWILDIRDPRSHTRQASRNGPRARGRDAAQPDR